MCMSTRPHPISNITNRSRSLSFWQKSLRSFCSCLPQNSSFSKKLRRAYLGKNLKHLRNVHKNFNMVFDAQNSTWNIFWKKQLLGSTIPLPDKNKLNSNVWILATGPSICDLNLEQLKNMTVLGVNGAIAACSPTGLQPDYYAITDRDFFETRMHLVEDAVNSGAHCFFSFNGIAKIAELSPHLLTKGKISLLETANRYYNIPQLPTNEWVNACQASEGLHTMENSKVGWSKDIRKGVFTANTIAYIGCQIASHLGAKNVFIAGMDLGSNSSSNARCYEKGSSARPSTIDHDYKKEILPAFQLLSKLEQPTAFWNLSAESRLPASVIKKISFEEALIIDRPLVPTDTNS